MKIYSANFFLKSVLEFYLKRLFIDLFNKLISRRERIKWKVFAFIILIKVRMPKYIVKCDNHKESNLKCGLHKESLMDQKQLSFVSCEILSPAGKYCHVIKDFII